jgi:hypothetical protein
MALLLLVSLLCSARSLAQSNEGELRVKVTDPSGAAVRCRVLVISEVNQYRETFSTDPAGTLDLKHLQFGIYKLQIQQPGFAATSRTVETHTPLPVDIRIPLQLAPVTQQVTVTADSTLLDPTRAGASNEIGSQMIEDRVTSLPGRSVQDLVNSEPGWLYEGNAVLHPRGSEYQTQFVIDGVPLTDNRSPSFGPELDVDDIDSMTIYTAGIPAEFGRKMGGVVEVNTKAATQDGTHGQLVLSGGSYQSAGAFADVQTRSGKNTFGATASGARTSHYLNPVVPQNYTTAGTVADFSLNYERDLTPNDRITSSVRHELSRFEIPNEQLQQAAGQLQTGDNFETIGILGYQHTFSPDLLNNAQVMSRYVPEDLDSNRLSTPILAFLHNSFYDTYLKDSLSWHHGRNDFKFGIEADSAFLTEKFNDIITDPTQFDPGTPTTFSFSGNRPDFEQSAFAQDRIRLGPWTIAAGLRWDHYQLLLNQNAFSPRFSVARYFPSWNMTVHASYDRVFQTPSFENILLSSSPSVAALDPNFLRLPVQPSRGDYYEAGASNSFFGKLRLDTNVFRRFVRDYADDDQLLNTGVSFPIAFDKAILYGAEGKIDVPDWHKFSGFLSYSYIVGNAWFPVTGGLFLGDDATAAAQQLSGHFPDSQDQRNTARARMQYQAARRVWLATGAEYGSGLPFDCGCEASDVEPIYGQQVIDRLNFDRGRIRPTLAVDAAANADLYKNERLDVHLQVDGENLNNRLNIIDFGGLFSGNAIAPGRSYGLRLVAKF